jgi:hypothetical protein
MGIISSLLNTKTMLRSIDSIPTQELEKIISVGYKRKTPQHTMDKLETAFAKRVTSEEHPLLTDMEPPPSEGVSVEEQLGNMFYRLKNPTYSGGMSKDGILSNMRSAIQDAGGNRNLTNKNILAAAEDAYNQREAIKRRILSRKSI